MNKKSIILCVVFLAVMLAGLGVAIGILYKDIDAPAKTSPSLTGERYALLPAVPSDAVFVGSFQEASSAIDRFISPSPFISKLSERFASGDMESLERSALLVSLHYSGDLTPLYVFDAGNSSPTPKGDVQELMRLADNLGLTAQFVDCSTFDSQQSSLTRRSLLLVSPSENIVKSSVRHLRKGVSLSDDKSFSSLAKDVRAEDVIFVSHSAAPRIYPHLLNSGVYRKNKRVNTGIFSQFADWTAFGVDSGEDGIDFIGQSFYTGQKEFIKVFENVSTKTPEFSKSLPSYTLFAASIPMGNMHTYMNAYKTYLDAHNKLNLYRNGIDTLHKKTKVSPEKWADTLAIEEVATASFKVGDRLESVNLIKVANTSAKLIYRPAGATSAKNFQPGVYDYKYEDFASALFGHMFTLKDESSYTYKNGWIISGSAKAVDEFASGKALSYTLAQYAEDASQSDKLTEKNTPFISYFSITEDSESLNDYLGKNLAEGLAEMTGDKTFCAVISSVNKEKDGLALKVSVPMTDLTKTKAPEFERDTTVVVPQGPFKVKNSGTGKMNIFYQQKNLYLCLQEESGKGLWGIPFSKELCGTAHNVDYYNNGKLQILFGAGSKVYVIDRLGRFVRGFPIELGKEILIGPDVYDFSGKGKYNIMVLHKDNTIEMYNLQGKKPEVWKGIAPEQKIKSLPERILLGANNFWVVRTSIQTLIYPFAGGEPLTVYEGDKMIRPDSEIKVVDATSVEVVCYDGHSRTIKLK